MKKKKTPIVVTLLQLIAIVIGGGMIYWILSPFMSTILTSVLVTLGVFVIIGSISFFVFR